MEPATADGTVAGSGDATAARPGTPSNERTGVATDDPPTPKTPISNPMPAPASVITGSGAIRPSSRSPAGERNERTLFCGPMGRIAGVTADETRERLLQAAIDVFALKGYEGATIADIARQA